MSGMKVHLGRICSPVAMAPGRERRVNLVVSDGRKMVQEWAARGLDMVERDWIPRIERGREMADPRVQLQGNFAPVEERTVEKNVMVDGEIPAWLEGMYVRNGANPQFLPEEGRGHHLFDGDGMIHGVKLERGRGSYCCRFTRTYRMEEERKAGKAMFPKSIGELHGHAGLARLLLYAARAAAGVVDASKGMGVANAGLVFHHGKLLAMSEEDLPYQVRVTPQGDLETVGRYDFQGQLPGIHSMLAHPKLDPETGEMVNLSYNVLAPPFLTYFSISADGIKRRQVDITLQQPTMMHDFAFTRRFLLVPDQQLVFNMGALLQGGSPLIYHAAKMPRFGVLPREDQDERRMQWIDVPGCFCLHIWNAWEEGEEEVVLIASCITPPDVIFNQDQDPHRSPATILSEIRLNRRTGTSSRRQLIPGLNLEAGQVNRRWRGKRSRYAYLAIVEPWPKVSGIAKVDLQAPCVAASITFPEHCFGGEPYFVPHPDSADEDQGCILTFTHHERSGKSKLLILDAQSPSLRPLATLHLPSRVPYGFHGTFIPAHDLAAQQSSS